MKLSDKVRALMAQGGSQRALGLSRRYQRTGDVALLQEAARHASSAVRLTPDGHPDEARHLSNLGGVLGDLFDAEGDLKTLELAVAAGRAAVAAAAGDDPGRAMYTSNLSGALTKLSAFTNDAELLAEAVALGQAAVAAARDDDPDRSLYLSNLCSTLLAAFPRTGETQTLVQAVRAGRAAVDALPPGHPGRFMYLSNLGLALRNLFEHTGDAQALSEAVDVCRAALAAVPDSHPRRAGCLSALSSALMRQYASCGDQAVLDEAVRVGRAAVEALPSGHPDRAVLLSNLGICLAMSFERTGDAEALTGAVAAGRAAVAACPDGHVGKPMYLINLAVFLSRLFQRTDVIGLLEEAVRSARHAVDLLPAGHPRRAQYLADLSTTLRALFEETGDTSMLEEALRADQAAVDAAPRGHPDRAMMLSNSGLTLRLKFTETGDAAALAQALRAGQDAVAACPDGNPEQARYRYALGMSQVAAFEHLGDVDALAQAREGLATAVGVTAAPIQMRVDAGQLRARAEMLAADYQAALAAMEAVIGLLPLVASRELRQADREHRLGEMAGIGAQGAAAALSAGQPERAVELLEQARGLLLAETIGTRGETARLREHAPDLLTEFERLRDHFAVLDSRQLTGMPEPVPLGSGPGAGAEGTQQDTGSLAGQRRDAVTAWDQLLESIRARPGLADFLAPPPVSELRRYASGGAIAIVTTDKARCDALIVTDDADRAITHVPLPDLDQDTVHEQVDRLLAARGATAEGGGAASKAAQDEISDILEWLWDTIAEPVLTALGHTASPGSGRWPRLWWCPVGAMAYLPLHAAGHHHEAASGTAHPRCVIDRAVSSYTATIRTLAYARRQPSAVTTQQALIVGMPHTDGAGDLPGVQAEVERLTKLMPSATVLLGRDATRDAVLHALPRHAVAHFACHGLSDWDDPGASQLLLSGHADRPLTVAAISRLHMDGAGLAYLSACSTSDTSPRLTDEAVHITAAFQLAGYRNVIGTLWPVADRSARIAAEAVYAGLTSQGATTPDTSRAAEALHQVVRAMRARYARWPAQWAAHIHMGGDPVPPGAADDTSA